ncbi:MAG: 1-deoxy-D-xylulose-5-phosphate synthase [Gammaproteobacteria bacterium]|nr:1-deoxy-D-xylulose-5-phosphate synthase [Gammaproteobacteria bacterium]MCW8923193.1 1-deoxy-D-xylulose-5-phosphate synthase [Gammaproteobacteria bacterium]
MIMPTSHPQWALLEAIDSPDDLRKLPQSQLSTLAQQLRSFLLESVANTGGHLSAGLGTVELTIALHYIFNTPDDRLIWDVGHQTYPHKILTGRREQMKSLRQKGGLAGFPKRDESEYDAFGTGHSSTSISAALGMSIAAHQTGSNRKTIAVIGDGALSGGMAFEALNHAGDSDADLLVILNDNDMSISPNVGGLSNHLTRVLSGSLYSTVREGSKKVLENIPGMLEIARRTEEHVKGMVAPGTLFEELGFNYYGPVDGHDLDALIPVLRNLSGHKGPCFLHVVTRKGKGYFPAEDDPGKFHGVSSFDTSTGESSNKSPADITFTQVFSDWLCDMAEEDERLVGITPAMREGSGLVEFSEKYPDRYFDVGIAEQHAVTLAAGMACDGLKPVVAIYSTFLQRAYDQLVHDVALQNLPVLFAIDRAGIVGADGPTHTGAYDISFLRCIPNMVIMTPADEIEARAMLTTGFIHDGPVAVRYPRGSGAGKIPAKTLNAIGFGKAQICREGKKIALLVFGTLLETAHKVAKELDATLVNMRFVKPLDEDSISHIAKNHELIVTLEENAIAGGAGSAVSEYLDTQSISIHRLHLGFPDKYVEQGTQQEMLADWGLDADGIRQSILEQVNQQLPI